jgi:hypothetical protein
VQGSEWTIEQPVRRQSELLAVEVALGPEQFDLLLLNMLSS